MQDLPRRYPGVISTKVGYTGGEVPNAIAASTSLRLAGQTPRASSYSMNSRNRPDFNAICLLWDWSICLKG
jgi:hypothetical protein